MAAQIISTNSFIPLTNSSTPSRNSAILVSVPESHRPRPFLDSVKRNWVRKFSIQCSETRNQTLRTFKNCKKQFDPSLNHLCACRYHSAHFGGETRRKFESVYTGGTMATPDSGKVFQYWHCCGSEDPFDLGCTAAPHASYDD